MKFIIWWVSWNVVSDVAMKENLCKTKTEVGEWCFSIFHDGLGSFVIVQQPVGRSVVIRDAFCSFYAKVSSSIGLWVFS